MSNVAPAAAARAAAPETVLAAGLFSTEEMNVLHRLAYSLYTRGAYDDAVRYFWFLSLHAPRDTRYLKGLGASLFMAKRFSEAAATYALLLHLAPLDPEVLCMSGHALLMQGMLKDARACLELAAALSGEKSEFAARAKALLELITK